MRERQQDISILGWRTSQENERLSEPCRLVVVVCDLSNRPPLESEVVPSTLGK